jgi:hypothetical protein
MADKAITNISTSIFLDEIKSSMGGDLNFEPADDGDKWIFNETAVSSSSGDLVTTIDFLGTDTATTTSDKVRWIAVKNISTIKTDGVCICFDGGTAAYNLVDGIFIGAGEMVVVKCPNTTMGNLHAVSVTMDGTYGYPSAAHTGSVTCQVAAIIDDV